METKVSKEITIEDQRTFTCNGCELKCFFTNDGRYNCPGCGLIKSKSDGYKCRDCHFECPPPPKF